MPSHRAAGTVGLLDADVRPDGDEDAASAPSAPWEERLRSRAGWATADLARVPAQSAGHAPGASFLPRQRGSAEPTTSPAAPVAAPIPAARAAAAVPAPRGRRSAGPAAATTPAPAPTGPVVLPPTAVLSAPRAPAPRLPEPVLPVVPALAAPAARPVTVALPVTAPAAPVQTRSGRRRADAPVDGGARALAAAPAPAPAAAPAPAPAPAAPVEAPAARVRRRADGPVDAVRAVPAAEAPALPQSRRARRAAVVPAVATTPVVTPPPAAARVPAATPAATPAASAPPAPAATGTLDLRVLAALDALSLPVAPPAPVRRTAAGASVADWTATSLPVLPAPHELDGTAPMVRVGEDGFAPDRGRRSHRQGRGRALIPSAGVAGVLGLTALVVPMLGDALPAATAGTDTATTGVQPVSGEADVTEIVAAGAAVMSAEAPSIDSADAAVREEAIRAAVSRGIAERQRLADEAAAAEAQRVADAAAAAEAEARAAEERAALEALTPGCDGQTPAGAAGEVNGKLDTDVLCDLWQDGHQLRADAAVSLARLNIAYRAEFGTDLQLTDSYRSYAQQVAVKRQKPGLAARPGTSEHGWGLAVDLGGGVEDADRHYDWLMDHAADFGWGHPRWAQRGGSGPYEPWHWEYVAGQG